MKYTHEQEISETRIAVYKLRADCKKCPIASRCAVKAYPPCNMKMVTLRERAADGLISDVLLKRYEAEYRGE